MTEILASSIFPPVFTDSYNGKYRVCLEKATGKLIEMQSHADHDTLILNAVKVGYLYDDIEVIEETKEEFAARLAAIPKEPQPKSQTEILQEQIQTLTLTIANLMLEGGV